MGQSVPVRTEPNIIADSNPKEEHGKSLLSIQRTSNRTTHPIGIMPMEHLIHEEELPRAALFHHIYPTQIAAHIIPPMRYGILISENQSWYTMKKIPVTQDARLYAYDNSQPGVGIYGFITKPISSKFSLQTGVGYHIYQNKSIQENRLFFDVQKVIQMPDGQSIYQTDFNLMNPLGDYSTLLNFRVSDQMHQNDLIEENTTIKQILHALSLDLCLNYKMISGKHFDISLGTGISLGYRSGLKNEFNVSFYHNDILQKKQTELPDHLNNVRRWFGQALGKLSIEYHPSDRFGILLESQYNAGITSLHNGRATNISQTYLHSFMISTGVTHDF